MFFIWAGLQTLAGILMAFAHPFRWADLAWEPSWWSWILASIGIAIFIKVSSLRSRAWHRFALGWWGAFVFFGITLYWITIALTNYGELPISIALLVNFLLVAYCALFWATWSWIIGFSFLRQKPLISRILLWASLWASLEVLREYLLTGFPWGHLGHSLAYLPSIASSASIWGVHGLSFLWIFVLCSLLHIDELFQNPKNRWQFATAFLLLGGILVIANLTFFKEQDTRELQVALVQPNIEQTLKWDRDLAQQHLQKLIEMTREAAEENPDLIVWPETSYPFSISEDQKRLPFSSGIPLVIGAVVQQYRATKNSALLVQEDRIEQGFEKVHLVPFGEYVPFQRWLPFESLVANVGNFRSGSKEQALLELDSLQLRMGVLICYEDIFSRHSIRQVRQGANLLVNITNDAWYGMSSALEQHAAIAHLQTYQTGVPMLRATNTGKTTIITRKGRTNISSFEQDILLERFQLALEPSQTFYAQQYPWILWIWLLLFAIGSLWRREAETRKIFFRE